nr:LysM peptidoglycan-binding domain-containing protein [Sedimentibacter sp.]
MIKEFWIKDEVSKINLRLPITPSTFSMTIGNKIETVNVTEIGDVNIVGTGTLAAIKLDSFFPKQNYNFKLPDTVSISENYDYINYFKNWKTNKTILRFIITQSNVNTEAVLESIEYSEKDSTGDIYYSINLREYRRLNAPDKSNENTNSTARPVTNPPAASDGKYTVQKGDTLWVIAKKYYGNGNLYTKIVKNNNIKNPNLIYPGQILII